MTHQEKLEAIRKACVKANPDIIVEGCESGITPCACWWHKNYPPDGNKYRPIRLADVLNAIMHTEYVVSIASNERFEVLDRAKNEWKQVFITWYLTRDSLEEQSEETVAFIYDLLK